jgi:hypothetical protein
MAIASAAVPYLSCVFLLLSQVNKVDLCFAPCLIGRMAPSCGNFSKYNPFAFLLSLLLGKG